MRGHETTPPSLEPARQQSRCSLCFDLQKKDEGEPRLALELSADQCMHIEETRSCDVCLLIVEGIRRFENESWSLATGVSRVYVYALSSKGDSLTLEVYFRTDRPKLVLEFYHTEDWVPPWDATRRRSLVTGYPVLTNGVEWLKSTLEQCLTQHALCTTSGDKSLLPTRTLHVARLSSGEIAVQLREHKNKRGCYVALSHCWGSQQTCVTTARNLEAYKMSVPWKVLPVTFQDAISFTLALDLHHIWVDSLCIIQGNAKDWEAESSRMGDIYHNSYLTLAATAARNGSEGCFSVHRTPVREYSLPVKDGKECVMVREKIRHWQPRSSNILLKSFPLLTRGWVLQERYPSPRTLHFCSNELVWDCLEDLTCECGGVLADSAPLRRLQLDVNSAESNESSFTPEINEDGRSVDQDETSFIEPPMTLCDPDSSGKTTAGRRKRISRDWVRVDERFGLPVRHKDKASPSLKTNHSTRSPEKLLQSSAKIRDFLRLDAAHGKTAPRAPLPNSDREPTLSFEHSSDQWHAIVEQYTSLTLTKETDRLPALSGLAMQAAAILGTYSCGLWLNTIANDLMWRVPLLDHCFGRPESFTGPSWSWASVNGAVAYWNDVDDRNISNHDNNEIERLQYEMNTLETWYDRKVARQVYERRLQERAARRRKPSELQATCDVLYKGENRFGEVDSAILTLRARVRSAQLLYVSYYDTVDLQRVRRHDPLRYQLKLDFAPDPSSELLRSTESGMSIELPFFADYILSEGPDRRDEGTLVTLLQLRQNICLVLTGGPDQYRRIGIVRQSSGYQAMYGLDWMFRARTQWVMIV